MRILYVITLAERGGAQVHVADLLRGFSGQCEIALATGEEGYLTELARSLCIPVYRLLHLVHPMQPFSDLRGTRELMRVLRSWDPDVIHAHTSKAGMLARVAGTLRRVPVVFTAHTWSFSDFFPLWQRAISIPLERIAAWTNCRIVNVCDANRNFALRHLKVRPEMIVTVWNGIPDTGFRATTGAPGRPRIVMVARFADPKEQG